MSNEDKLLSKLDSYIDTKNSAYCINLITSDQILTNLYNHIDCNIVNRVFLRGSRATGRSNPYSDVDLLVFVNEEKYDVINFKDDNGVRYNVQIISDVREIESISNLFYGIKPIYDRIGNAEDICIHLNNIEQNKCRELARRSFDSIDYLNKLVNYIGFNDVYVSSFFKAKLIKEYPVFLSVYNGYELLGYKHTIDCLIRDEYDLAMLYARVMENSSTQRDAKNLVDSSFYKPCNLNVLNVDFKNSKKAFDINVDNKSMYEMYEAYSNLIDYLRLLKSSDQSEIDFFRLCKNEYPILFERLWTLTHNNILIST